MSAIPQSDFFVRPPEPGALNVALVAGPMYDSLYELLPEFEQKSGRRVHVAARLVHPELNAHLEQVYRAGTGLTISSPRTISMPRRKNTSCAPWTTGTAKRS